MSTKYGIINIDYKTRKGNIKLMIVMAGTIGVGKSTLTEILSNDLGTEPFYEPVGDNPILPLYYENPKEYGFLLQIYFLNKRFDLIKKAYKQNNNVLDRSIFEDLLFTQINYKNGNLTKEELQVYESLLNNMMEELEGMPKKSPDLLVYLYADFDTIISRIGKRGRDYEQVEENNGLLEYYRTLWNEYQSWYENYNISPKIKIDVGKNDLSTIKGKENTLKTIKKELAVLGLL